MVSAGSGTATASRTVILRADIDLGAAAAVVAFISVRAGVQAEQQPAGVADEPPARTRVSGEQVSRY